MSENLPEMYERAPTLVAGETPHSQGEVRVWYPRDQRVLKEKGSILLVGTVGSLLVIRFHLQSQPFADAIFACVMLPLSIYYLLSIRLLPPGNASYGHVWKLSRVSTDDAGIALAAGDRTVALSWSDVVGWYNDPRMLRSILYTRSNGAIVVSFRGYDAAVRKELSDTIRASAALLPLAQQRRWLSPLRFCVMREGYIPLGSGQLSGPHRSLPLGPP